MFVKLFKAGLAEKKLSPVNWCPACKTVLADEMVIDGKCERCDATIETRELEQWSLKITRYADRLLDGIEHLQWSEVIKKIQRNWIGKSNNNPGDHEIGYRLHDWVISRQRYWGTPIPIIYCDKCGIQPVPEEQLPVLLPDIENWKPKGTGNSPLADIPDFVKTTCPYCGGNARRETDVMDNFVDSSWYYLRYPSIEFTDKPWDEDRTKKWLPVDMYFGGKEHAVLHLMYTRFICLVLYDLGYIDFENPFKRYYAHGVITKDGSKMSKSRSNIVEPDKYFDQYGADTLRIYLMFMGPFEYDNDFSDLGIAGIYRFLNRVWNLCIHKMTATNPLAEGERFRNIVINKVMNDYEKLKYNTVIATIMEYLNVLERQEIVTRIEIETLLLLLAPLAPHLTEELWQRIGNQYSIHNHRFPACDPKWNEKQSVDISIQINGRLISVIQTKINADKEDISKIARNNEKVADRLKGKCIKKIIYITGRTINFVTD